MTRVGLFTSFLLLCAAACAQEIVTVPTRPGVTQSFFMAGMGGVETRAVALMYSGGYGEIKLRMEEGQPKFQQGNFLPRSRREFIRNGVLPVLVDVPSDSSIGVSDPYRRSDAQTADARAVITTSRSTLSAAHLARVFGADEVAGVVLTSSMVAAGPRWESIGSLDPASVRVPVLFVHHREDGCGATPYSGAARLAEKFTLISVKGGTPPKSGPCEPFAAHGFLGKEAETVDAITGWMLRKPFAKDIE
jgi:hypothetical protein